MSSAGHRGHERPLQHHVRHSPTGLAWGCAGSWPADLAQSILADRIGWPPPPAVYQQLNREVVAGLPRDGLELAAAQVDAWLARHYPLVRQLADRADDLHGQVIELASRVEDRLQAHGDDCTGDQRLAWQLAPGRRPARGGRLPRSHAGLELSEQPAVQRAQPACDGCGQEL